MSVVRQFLIYGIGGAGSRLAAIILVPLYTRTLSMDEFGQLEVLLAAYALAVLVVGLQAESAIARDYFEAKEEGQLGGLLWSAATAALLGTGLLTLVVGVAALSGIIPAEFAYFAPLLLAMAVPSQLLGIQLVVLRFAGTPIFFAALTFLDLALSAAFSALLVIHYELGVAGALFGLLSAKLICVALAWPRTFRGLRREALLPPLRRTLAYSLPTMPAVLLNWIQTNGNRILLAMFLPLGDVAIAGLAIKVAALYGFLSHSFRLAWEPYSFEKLSTLQDDPDVYNRSLEWYVLIMFLFGGVATLFAPLVVAVLAPPAYATAAKLVGFFIVGQFWIGALTILCIGIHGARVTSRLSIVFGLGALANVALLIILAQHFGVLAAAVALMAGAMASALLAAYYSEHYFKTGFNRRLIGWAMGITALFALVSWSSLSALEQASGSAVHALVCYLTTGGVLIAGLAAIARFGMSPARLRGMMQMISNLAKAKAAGK